MNGQLLTKIDNLEKELKEVKKLLKEKKQKPFKKSDLAGIWKTPKPSKKLSDMKGLWKKLEITDEELEEAKKAVFDFDVDKYVDRTR